MAATTIEKVQVILQTVTAGFAKGMDRVKNKFQTVGKNMNDFGQVMQTPLDKFKEMNGRMKVMKTSGGRLAHGIRGLTHGMRGFRMEMLGVMFFGMAITRLFGGMLKPAADAMGIFELWGETMAVLFLPTMISLFPAIVDVSTALMNLPEGAKEVIGGIALAFLGLGSILAIGGTLSLGLGSLIIAFSGTSSAAGMLTAQLTALSLVTKGISLVAGLALTYVWAKGVGAMMTDLQTSWNDRLMSVLSGTFAGAAIGFTFGGPAGALIGASIGLGISLIVNLLDIAWEAGFDQKMSDFVNGAIEKIKGYINRIQGWWAKLRVSMQLGGEGVSTTTEYDDEGVGTLRSSKNDFIWRAGQGAVAINPNDNLVGFKGAPPNLGGGNSSGATINQTLNINVSNQEEIIRLIRSENDALLNKLQRNIG